MKPYIILYGLKYYPSRWEDYAGEADSVEEATTLAEAMLGHEDDDMRRFHWYQIIDLRTKECVLQKEDDGPAYDPRSS